MNTAQPASKGFRDLVHNELLSRCRQNPQYSLRAFARHIGLAPSTLSMILNGQRGMSLALIRKIGPKLGVTGDELNAYLRAGNENGKDEGRYQQLAFDHFRIISDWYHYALLELTAIRGFKPDLKWIAARLGITVADTRLAIERLVRLEMLDTSGGRWIDRSPHVTNLDNPLVASSRRKHQAQVLRKAAEALEKTAIDERDQSSMIMAIDSSRLAEAKQRLTRFRRELTEYLQGGDPDRVYALSLSLFPLTSQAKEKSQ